MATDPTLEVEHRLLDGGATWVIGCDEVGRGAVAGPVAVGMVALCAETPPSSFPSGLRDSKMVTATARSRLDGEVKQWAAAWHVGFASNTEIDEFGISTALGRAGTRAFLGLGPRILSSASTSVIVLDGSFDWLTPRIAELSSSETPPIVRTRVKADRDCASVSAASIVAKVRRDAAMVRLAPDFAAFGWDSNKGYGTPSHLAAIRAVGPSPWHRVSWLHGIESDRVEAPGLG